jgi:hypothetical protein
MGTPTANTKEGQDDEVIMFTITIHEAIKRSDVINTAGAMKAILPIDLTTI